MSFGNWEGRFRDEIEKEYSAEFKAIWETPHLYERKSGKLFHQVSKQLRPSWIKSFKPIHPAQFSSFSILLRTLLANVKDLSLEVLCTQHPIGHASLTKIILTDQKSEIIFEGGTSHFELKLKQDFLRWDQNNLTDESSHLF